MKVPDSIGTLDKLGAWCDKNKPKVMDIGKKSKLREIGGFWGGFQDESWQWYRDIKIKYLK